MSFGTRFATASLSPTVTAGAYSANDVVGGLLSFTLPEFANNIKIQSVTVFTKAAVAVADFELWLFKTTPATIADNGAFWTGQADADAAMVTTVIRVPSTAATNGFALSNHTITTAYNLNAIVTTEVAGALKAYLVCKGTPTYGTTSDLTITIGFEY